MLNHETLKSELPKLQRRTSEWIAEIQDPKENIGPTGLTILKVVQEAQDVND